MALARIAKSETPVLAPENYNEMAPVERYQLHYAVSGVKLKDHPLNYESVDFIKDQDVCRHCSSNNTRIIFFSYYGDLIGKTSDSEIVCNDCSKYTQFHYDDSFGDFTHCITEPA